MCTFIQPFVPDVQFDILSTQQRRHLPPHLPPLFKPAAAERLPVALLLAGRLPLPRQGIVRLGWLLMPLIYSTHRLSLPSARSSSEHLNCATQSSATWHLTTHPRKTQLPTLPLLVTYPSFVLPEYCYQLFHRLEDYRLMFFCATLPPGIVCCFVYIIRTCLRSRVVSDIRA